MTQVFLASKGLILRNGIGYDQFLTQVRENRRIDTLESLCLSSFNAGRELADRRLLRAIATKDVYGLVALDRCQAIVDTPPERTAMFIGAQVPLAADNAGYLKAIEEAHGQEDSFGGSINLAHPMTLLTSLANNVLCYGAIKYNVRGVNSNYTNMETSSHIALINALLAMQNGKAEAAYVGGYSALCHDKTHVKMLETQGYLCQEPTEHQPLSGRSQGSRLADGACFITLTSESAAVEVIDGELCNDNSGPHVHESDHRVLVNMIDAVLERQNLNYKDIGGLFLSGHGSKKTDDLELGLLTHIKNTQENLRAYSAGAFTGNLTEAGGIIELALSETMQADPALRAALSLHGEAQAIAAPYVLHVRSGLWGDHSCVLTRLHR